MIKFIWKKWKSEQEMKKIKIKTIELNKIIEQELL